MKTFSAIREQYLPVVEKHLAEFLLEYRSRGSVCAEMTSYHLETGGKRLRALIPLSIYDAYDKDPISAVPLGAAVEMIHNATLVHDDLQDGDEFRRGLPTVWKKYSSVQAINCGDAMFEFAVRLLARLEIEPAHLLRVMDRAAAATINVIEGQVQEFRMKDETLPGINRYLEVVRGKTSGLFGLPIVGALEALGVSPANCRLAESAATDLGVLFQIQDDLVDIYGNKGREQVATDIAEGKTSFLVAHVNDTGALDDKEELSQILKKPRAATSKDDISRAMRIFENNGAKAAAIAQIRKLQSQFHAVPKIAPLFEQLSEQVLRPILS